MVEYKIKYWSFHMKFGSCYSFVKDSTDVGSSHYLNQNIFKNYNYMNFFFKFIPSCVVKLKKLQIYYSKRHQKRQS